MFGYPVSLLYSGQSTFTTPLGVFFTIVAAAIMLAFFVELVNKDDKVYGEKFDDTRHTKLIDTSAESSLSYTTFDLVQHN